MNMLAQQRVSQPLGLRYLGAYTRGPTKRDSRLQHDPNRADCRQFTIAAGRAADARQCTH
jgi:hypothetical protein